MKVVKIIFKLFISLLFICSIALNIFTFRSSYGSLLLKYDDNKFSSMVSARYLDFNPAYFLNQKDTGLQMKVVSTKDGKTETKLYEFHFNDNGELTTKISETDSNSKTSYSYYKDNVLYKEVGQLKTKIPTDKNIFVTSLFTEILSYQQILVDDISKTDTKTSIDFSFNSGYLLGLKYKMNEDTCFYYDLEGRLRKIETSLPNETVKTFEITYKNQAVTLPDLSKY